MEKEVLMIMDFDLIFKEGLKESEKYDIYIEMFKFLKDGKVIPFKMRDFSYSIDHTCYNILHVNWYSESDARLRGYEIKRDISDRFDDEYKKLGLKREDITAEFLSQADSIEEIKINVVKTNGFSEFLNKEDYNININGIEFYDENLRRYYVINKVIEDYNVKNLKQLLLRRV